MQKGVWLARAARGVRLDRNPLRRRWDRAEAIIFGGLVVVAAAGAPVAATMAGNWAHADAARTARVQQETRHQVRAVLLAPPHASNASGYTISGMSPAMARWTAPSGAKRTGEITVPSDSAKGTTVSLWTDQAGAVTSPPLTPSQVADQGTLMALVTAAMTGVACLLAAVATRIAVNRRRMAAWTADWAVTAPMWTRQRW